MLFPANAVESETKWRGWGLQPGNPLLMSVHESDTGYSFYIPHFPYIVSKAYTGSVAKLSANLWESDDDGG